MMLNHFSEELRNQYSTTPTGSTSMQKKCQEAIKKYKQWLTFPDLDNDLRIELENMQDNYDQILESFGSNIEFGTAGLRGIIGAGTNRMNKYTVRAATQGVSEYIVEQGLQDKGVVAIYDSRRMSKEFAEEAALVFAANGIKVNIYDSLRPSPQLTYSITELGCAGGINITASHNPKEYNGFKLYWKDGAGINAPHDENIMVKVNEILADYSRIKTIEKEAAIQEGLYNVLNQNIDDKYIDTTASYQLNPTITKEQVENGLKVVYTPLHGSGNIPVQRILSKLGLKKDENFFVVSEQEMPDSSFPTVHSPNPEDNAAMKIAIKLAEEVNADVILATDPDADRLGVQVKDNAGNFHNLDGDLIGCLMAEYIISQKDEREELPENGYILTTILSSELIDKIAEQYKLEVKRKLTGFKYIGEEKVKNQEDFVFAFETSLGSLFMKELQCKDGIGAAMMITEIAAFYKSQNKTIWEHIENMYDKYGYYKNKISDIYFEGLSGKQEMSDIMQTLRESSLETIGDNKIIVAKDYQNDICVDRITNETYPTGLPQSNVLYYELEDGSWACIRPSRNRT